MKRAKDKWYVRLPDGQVFYAPNTKVVREYLRTGRISPQSTVRRSRSEEWVLLEWTQEFADLCVHASAPTPSLPQEFGPSLERVTPSYPPADEPATVASRLDPSGLRLPGVRGLLEELRGALDSTATPRKLLVIVLVGLAVGLAVAWLGLPVAVPLTGAAWFPWAFAAGALAVLAGFSALLVNLAYTELAQMRPADWGDGFRGALGLTLRLFLSQGMLLGALLALIGLLRLWAPWLLDEGAERWGPTGEAFAVIALVVGQLLEVLVWPLGLLSLLIGPVLAVEECSALSAPGRWFRLVNAHRGKAFLGQFLAAATGLVLALPLGIPLLSLFAIPDVRFEPTVDFLRTALTGGIVAFLAGYLVVANLFLYLNLRYTRPAP
jgi:hypothetical protein